MTKYEIECYCGDIIEAESKEEAIAKFVKKHNFPIHYTKEDWQSEAYTQEFKVTELEGDV